MEMMKKDDEGNEDGYPAILFIIVLKVPFEIDETVPLDILNDQFQKMGVEIYAVSTDTHFTHKAWHDSSETIGKIKFPMVGDPTATIARNFGVLIEDGKDAGLALRGTFVINPEGEIKVAEIHDLGIGRSAKELIRKVQAAQYVAQHGDEVCPASWQPGEETLTPSLDLVGKI